MENSVNCELYECWFDKQIDGILKIEDEKFRTLLMLSLIDACSQGFNEHQKRGNRQAFVSFLEEFSVGCKHESILKSICPVTLFYDLQDEFGFDELRLNSGSIYNANDTELIDETNRLVQMIPLGERNKAKKHRYVELVYTKRNKLVHEMRQLGLSINFQEERESQVPHVVHGWVEATHNNTEEYWELHIPEQFIYEVIVWSAHKYFKWCRVNQKIPFNGSQNTKRRYAWYE